MTPYHSSARQVQRTAESTAHLVKVMGEDTPCLLVPICLLSSAELSGRGRRGIPLYFTENSIRRESGVRDVQLKVASLDQLYRDLERLNFSLDLSSDWKLLVSASFVGNRYLLLLHDRHLRVRGEGIGCDAA